MLPPQWLRRLLLAPAQLFLTLVLFTTLPLWVVGAAFASTWLPGRWRALRVIWFGVVYLVADAVVIVWMFGLWIGSGFGYALPSRRWQDAHYRAMFVYLDVLVRTGMRTFKVGFHVDLQDLADIDPAHREPLLVFSRHAGPGDSFLLIHALLRVGYRPRIVLKETLQWAPLLDIGLNRIPTYFVRRGAPRGTGTRAIGELAAGLGDRDALVIFPEGRNYTPQRRLHSIAKLEELDRHLEAEQAREMRYVLTPRTGGALAALGNAPTADVLFVAHTGLEDFSSLMDLWRGIPIDADVRLRGWHVPRDHVPRVRAAQEAWLQWWWRRIDAWVIEHYGVDAAPDAVVDAVTESDIEPAP